MYNEENILKSGGVEMRGLKASLAPRRQQAQNPPKLERYLFVPYENKSPLAENEDKSRIQALTVNSQLVLENSKNAIKLKVVEVALDKSVEGLMTQDVQNILEAEPLLTVEATVVIKQNVEAYNTVLDPLGIKIVEKDVATTVAGENAHLALGSGILSHPSGKSILKNMQESLKPEGFILLEESAVNFEKQESRQVYNSLGLELISLQRTTNKVYALLRKPVLELPKNYVVVNVSENHFDYVEPLKEALVKSEAEGLTVYLICHGEETTGMVGMMNCIRQEAGMIITIYLCSYYLV